jgi:hypothetical protein
MPGNSISLGRVELLEESPDLLLEFLIPENLGGATDADQQIVVIAFEAFTLIRHAQSRGSGLVQWRENAHHAVNGLGCRGKRG